jgi:catechol 2,3-dioxygenase-like lactoylglutathione lyase family enzyme
VGQTLDHFGFVVESPEAVEEYERRMRGAGVRIVKPFKHHRDGSSSFYMADPDGNVIQILYEPHISPMKLG